MKIWKRVYDIFCFYLSFEKRRFIRAISILWLIPYFCTRRFVSTIRLRKIDDKMLRIVNLKYHQIFFQNQRRKNLWSNLMNTGCFPIKRLRKPKNRATFSQSRQWPVKNLWHSLNLSENFLFFFSFKSFLIFFILTWISRMPLISLTIPFFNHQVKI